MLRGVVISVRLRPKSTILLEMGLEKTSQVDTISDEAGHCDLDITYTRDAELNRAGCISFGVESVHFGLR